MTPLQYETMMLEPISPRRLRLLQSHDIVHRIAICWAIMWSMQDSPFQPRDYYVQTIGLDGVE